MECNLGNGGGYLSNELSGMHTRHGAVLCDFRLQTAELLWDTQGKSGHTLESRVV